MNKFEYIIIKPRIDEGMVVSRYEAKEVPKKDIFGNKLSGTKTVINAIKITEQEWLNKMGEDGWELVSIITNNLSHDIKGFYFKRVKE